MSLLGILIALIVIGLLLWAIRTVLGVIAIPEPFKTIIWVIVVVVACLMFLEMSGLYHFNINLR
jgi:hypothetical protein